MKTWFGIFSEEKKTYSGISGICQLLEIEWRDFKKKEKIFTPRERREEEKILTTDERQKKFQQELPIIICDILWDKGVEIKGVCKGVRDLLDKDLSEIESSQGKDGRYIKSQLKSLITAFPSASDSSASDGSASDDDHLWNSYRKLEAKYSILLFCMKDCVRRENEKCGPDLQKLIENMICISKEIICSSQLTVVYLKKEDFEKFNKIDTRICGLIKKLSGGNGSLDIDLKEALEISMELKSCNHVHEKLFKTIRDAMQA